MRAALDGQNLFDDKQVEIELESAGRASIEKAMPGLDGVLSIDLGRRSRRIKQTGVLRAGSRAQMNEMMAAISAYMDGDTHTLTTDSRGTYENLRLDVFKAGNERTSGVGVTVDYEIIYAQLDW